MAKPGSYWIEGSYFRWLDASGIKRGYIGKYVSTPSGAKPGSVWIEGANLHYIAADGKERRLYKSQVKTTAGRPGSAWVEGTSLCYLDASKNKKKVCDTCEEGCQSLSQLF